VTTFAMRFLYPFRVGLCCGRGGYYTGSVLGSRPGGRVNGIVSGYRRAIPVGVSAGFLVAQALQHSRRTTCW
jgi:hypothetical protein